MILKNLALSNFRNTKNLTVQFGSKTNVLLGQNGQGKTNILESVYALAKGVSFKNVRPEQMVNCEHSSCHVRGEIQTDRLDVVEFAVDKIKSIKINNKRAYIYNLLKKFPLILFEPSSIEAIKRGPDQRRNLIDSLIELDDPEFVKVFFEFNKVLKTRNSILKNAKEKKIPKSKAYELIGFVDQKFFELSSTISQKRAGLLEKIASTVKDVFQDMVNKKPEDFCIQYLINKTKLESLSTEDILSLIKAKLDQPREFITGFSLIGPQTDDISFLFDQKNAKHYLSQGEQRALILAFKIAMMYHCVALGKRPMLLLDDVFSELDLQRRGYLIHILKEAESQIIITATEIEKTLVFDKLFMVENGRINKI